MFVRQLSSSFQGWQRRVSAGISFRSGFSSVFVAEFRDDIRITIRAIGEHVKDSNRYLSKAAIELLSSLAGQGMC